MYCCQIPICNKESKTWFYKLQLHFYVKECSLWMWAVRRNWVDQYGMYVLQSIFLWSLDQIVRETWYEALMLHLQLMDMKSHTGYCLTLGTRSPISGLLGHINIRSSTESKLVGVYCVIGYVEGTSHYCKDQMKDYPIANSL